jgi:hypothetical protein
MVVIKYLKGLVYGGSVGFVATLIAYFLLSISVEIFTGKNSKLYPLPDFAFLFFILGIAIGILRPYLSERARSIKRKCPKCDRLHGKTTSRNSRSFEYPSSYTKTYRTEHYNAEGKFRGHSEVEGETVHYTATEVYYEWTLTCDGCGHKWSGDNREF